MTGHTHAIAGAAAGVLGSRRDDAGGPARVWA